MTGRGGTRSGTRAAIAVVALYAFVLQAFLAAMLPIPAAAPPSLGGICAPLADDDRGSAPAKHDAKSCCIAASALALPSPGLDASSVAWPRRPTVRFTFDSAVSPLPRGPPFHARFARGPPEA